MARVQPTTAIDMDKAGRSPCCDADLVLSSPPNVYECRECMRRYDTDAEAQGESENGADGDLSEGDTETGNGSDGADAAGTCAATTADGAPCQNSAGEDGYCHLASHGPD